MEIKCLEEIYVRVKFFIQTKTKIKALTEEEKKHVQYLGNEGQFHINLN